MGRRRMIGNAESTISIVCWLDSLRDRLIISKLLVIGLVAGATRAVVAGLGQEHTETPLPFRPSH